MMKGLVEKGIVAAAWAAGLTAAACGLVAAVGVRRMTRRRRPDPPADPGGMGLDCEPVTFRARDGLMLRGWFFPLPGSDGKGPVVVFCHGHSGSMDPDMEYVPCFLEAGFGVLMFDFRAHGRSEGHWVTMGYQERWDVLGAVDYLRQRGAGPVGVLGFSMGGAAAILAAAECRQIQAVAVDGAFARLLPVVAAGSRAMGLPGPLARVVARLTLRLASWSLNLPVHKAQPLQHVGWLTPRPILFIHGGRDKYVPLGDALALYQRAGFPKSMWLVGEAGHREVHANRPEAYCSRLTAFFRRALRPDG